MTRIYERDTDRLFIGALRRNPAIGTGLLSTLGLPPASVKQVRGQTRHVGSTGTIDIDVTFTDGTRLMVENKIDAGYSITRMGEDQPARYRRTIEAYRAQGANAHSVLLAPAVYLASSRSADAFDARASYESFLEMMEGEDRALLNAAIDQAKTPYEPDPNPSTGAFFLDYRQFVRDRFPALILKPDPNANGDRPTGSRTFYFDTRKTLVRYSDLPNPSMSLQCWDSNAPSASVKIMLPRWGRFAASLAEDESLVDIGAYLRPAGQSLGVVIDTPRLETQRGFANQVEEVTEGLEAALRLQAWWADSHRLLQMWREKVMGKRYEIKRMANIKAPDGAESVFYEVWEVFDVDGEERSHRNADLAFKSEAEAQAWIDKQSG